MISRGNSLKTRFFIKKPKNMIRFRLKYLDQYLDQQIIGNRLCASFRTAFSRYPPLGIAAVLRHPPVFTAALPEVAIYLHPIRWRHPSQATTEGATNGPQAGLTSRRKISEMIFAIPAPPSLPRLKEKKASKYPQSKKFRSRSHPTRSLPQSIWEVCQLSAMYFHLLLYNNILRTQKSPLRTVIDIFRSTDPRNASGGNGGMQSNVFHSGAIRSTLSCVPESCPDMAPALLKLSFRRRRNHFFYKFYEKIFSPCLQWDFLRLY